MSPLPLFLTLALVFLVGLVVGALVYAKNHDKLSADLVVGRSILTNEYLKLVEIAHAERSKLFDLFHSSKSVPAVTVTTSTSVPDVRPSVVFQNAAVTDGDSSGTPMPSAVPTTSATPPANA